MKKFYLFLVFLFGVLSAIGQTVFINEIHYDNEGTDANEGFEIAAEAGTNLFGWRIVLYNGSNGQAYSSIVIANFFPIPNQSNGFGFLTVTHSGIQNGAPDGFALVNSSDSVVQFLSYEGTITATNGLAMGLTSTDIGVLETSSTAATESLQLIGYGNEYSDFTWQMPTSSSFGDVNLGQTFGEGEAPETYDANNFEVLSNTEIHITFSDKLSSPLKGFNIISTSLSNVSETILSDSILVLTFDPFTLGTTQSIEISKDLENIEGELLSQNVSESFLFNNSLPPLVITEIMYNNGSEITSADKLEFIEFYNNSSSEIFLGGLSVANGIEYNFPEGAILSPNSFYIICKDSEDFQDGFGLVNVPEWSSGSLGNTKDTILILNTENDTIDFVAYADNNDWPKEADGEGPSLEIINPTENNNLAENWRKSSGFIGVYDNVVLFATPYSFTGNVIVPLNIIGFRVLNNHLVEFTFSTAIDTSFLDLSKITGLDNDLSIDSFKSDSILTIGLSSKLALGQMHTIIAPTDFVQDTNGLPMAQDFETIFLFNNSTPNLIISEIMYNLPGSDTGLEFIELYNNSDDTINISGFSFSHGISHTFPINTKVSPRDFMLLGDNGTKLTQLFGTPFTSWNSGSLLNSGELVRIVNANNVAIDRVNYSPNSPWPKSANGKGASLEIINPAENNNDAANWRPSEYYAATIASDDIFASPGALEISTEAFFYFTSDSISLYEGETAAVQVHLKYADKINASVNIDITNSAATELSDYILHNNKIVYNGNEVVFDIEFTALKDFKKEPAEFFELSLQSPIFAHVYQNNKVRIHILDTDQGSANICINEIRRSSDTHKTSPLNLPFIEFANVDFYTENFSRYNLKIESIDSSVTINLNALIDIKSNSYNTLWFKNSDDFKLAIDILNSPNNLNLSLYKDNILVQAIDVPELEKGMVYARETDCNENFEIRSTATPNASNNLTSILEIDNKLLLKIHPNPASDRVGFETHGNYTLYNAMGIKVMRRTGVDMIDISSLEQGIYIVRSDNGEASQLIKK